MTFDARKLGAPEFVTGPGCGSSYAQRPPHQPHATPVGAVVLPLLGEPFPERLRDLPRRPVEQVVYQPVHRQAGQEPPATAALRCPPARPSRPRQARSTGSIIMAPYPGRRPPS